VNNVDPLPPDDAVEAAISLVLGAEREAREAVASAQEEAAAITERARADARAIAQRAERRIRAARAAFERRVSERLAQIETEQANLDARHELGPDDLAGLERAVETLAAALTTNGR
jgi:regulator of protease activity HflC (stomatin/prohibitin superfamily)